ncbi:MAG: sigma-70 family RNA polymerase sigma factor [Actinomycetota bacterium]
MGARQTADHGRQESAIADLFDREAPEVFRYVHRRCGDRALAEDITQEAFVAAVRSDLAPGDITAGWLIRVASNRLIDVLRRQTNYERKIRLVPVDDDLDIAEMTTNSIRVREALDALTVTHRIVLTMHYVDGLTVAALADHLDRSPRAVESLITRAKRRLRDELGGAS